VNTACKATFALATFHNSSADFATCMVFYLCWVVRESYQRTGLLVWLMYGERLCL